jgi:hypothetical protein
MSYKVELSSAINIITDFDTTYSEDKDDIVQYEECYINEGSNTVVFTVLNVHLTSLFSKVHSLIHASVFVLGATLMQNMMFIFIRDVRQSHVSQ